METVSAYQQIIYKSGIKLLHAQKSFSNITSVTFNPTLIAGKLNEFVSTIKLS
jgi:hypothetical protein